MASAARTSIRTSALVISEAAAAYDGLSAVLQSLRQWFGQPGRHVDPGPIAAGVF
jgi:hypothetical protein